MAIAISSDRLRVALLAGCLGKGGAEKQLLYLVRALRSADVDVRIFSLTRGEHYEERLRSLGVPPIYIGQSQSRVRRLVALASLLRAFRPHVVQSAHFFTNLYAALGARFCGAIGIGAVRSDTVYDIASNGRWGRWLLSVPAVILTNSMTAARGALDAGRTIGSVKVLGNVVDLAEFDGLANRQISPRARLGTIRVAVVGSLIPVKRFDLFLRAFQEARRCVGSLEGLIIGDGPERLRLESLAQDLGLLPDGVTFLGRRDDVPELLAESDLLVLASDHEGFPNVVLEGMAARLPIVTTPAGDAPQLVLDGASGFVVPFDSPQGLASRIVELAHSSELRVLMGREGRRIAEERYAWPALGPQALSLYAELLARPKGSPALERARW